MRSQSLPSNLGPVFSVAAATDLGLTRSRLRARDLRAPRRGVRERREVLPVSTGDEWSRRRASALRDIARYAEIMPPEQFFCGVAAAVIYDVPLPPWCVPESGFEPDVAVFSPQRTPRGARIRGHTVATTHASVRSVGGLRVTSPPSTFAMLAGPLRDVRDLVAVGDALVREAMFRGDPSPLATLDALGAAVAAGRRPGVIRLREAFELVRTRAASAGESRCRVELMLAGLPEPELNVDIADDDGRFVACVDMVFRTARVIVEYEGDHHRTDARQWARDIERHDRLRALGWTVLRVTSEELYREPWELVRRVRTALGQAR